MQQPGPRRHACAKHCSQHRGRHAFQRIQAKYRGRRAEKQVQEMRERKQAGLRVAQLAAKPVAHFAQAATEARLTASPSSGLSAMSSRKYSQSWSRCTICLSENNVSSTANNSVKQRPLQVKRALQCSDPGPSR